MPLRITILSGDRQGQTLEFDQDVIEIGEQASDDIPFDATANPGIRDRRATLKLQDGSWKVVRSGSMPIFLNQETVNQSADLRSGDFLRMSHDGPDLSCELIGQLSPVAIVVSAKPVATPATPPNKPTSTSTATSAPQTSTPSKTRPALPTTPQSDGPVAAGANASSRNLLVPIAAGVALLALLALVLPAIGWLASSESSSDAQPEFVPFGVIVVKEGEQVFWRPTLVRADQRDRFELGSDAPTGMTIDESTGTVRWQTNEADGPGEFRCELIVRRGEDASQIDSDWLEIKVEEVNRRPEPSAIATQTVDLRSSRDLQVTLSATDPDLPAQPLSFRLGADAPEGVELDSKTGVLTWQVPVKYANLEVVIPYLVSDNSGVLNANSLVRVRVVMPDPWELAQQQLRGCLYVIVTETDPGKLVVPLGTACAIADNQLLTSASVAHGINDARGRGWKVLAADTRIFNLNQPQGWGIERVQSHAVYVRAQSIEDPQQRDLQQAFFDLAILTTDRHLPQTCSLGDLASSVKNDQTVACYGFEVEEDSLTQFDSLEPLFTKTKVLEVVPPPNEAVIEGRPPFLLQLIGELPVQPFGSIVIDEQGDVLGIYAFQGQLPEDVDSEPIHYAVDSVHAKAYLAGQGTSLWVETEPIRAAAENQ